MKVGSDREAASSPDAAKLRCRRDRLYNNRDCVRGDPPKLLLPAGSRVPKRNRLSSRGSLWPQNLVGRFAFPRSNRLSSGGSLLPQNLVGSFAFPRSNRLSSGGSLLPQNLTNTVHRSRAIPRYCLGILNAWPQKLVMSFAFPRSNRLSSGGTLLPQNLVGSFAFPRNNRLSSGGVPACNLMPLFAISKSILF